MYGATISDCSAKPGPEAPIRASSSLKTAEARKSASAPPYSAGSVMHRNPSSPARRQIARGTTPWSSQAAWNGAISRSQKRRIAARMVACSGSKIVRGIPEAVEAIISAPSVRETCGQRIRARRGVAEGARGPFQPDPEQRGNETANERRRKARRKGPAGERERADRHRGGRRLRGAPAALRRRA